LIGVVPGSSDQALLPDDRGRFAPGCATTCDMLIILNAIPKPEFVLFVRDV
jgi:hypothetical protein